MPLDEGKLKQLYGALQDGGYGQDYDTFKKGFTGNEHYENRKKVYDLLTENGAQIGSTYEEFMQKMQKPRVQPSAVNSGSVTNKVQGKPAVVADGDASAMPAVEKLQQKGGTYSAGSHGAPLSEQDRIRIGAAAWQLGQNAVKGVKGTNARLGRLTGSVTLKGKKRERLGDFRARVSGTPTTVAGAPTVSLTGNGVAAGNVQKDGGTKSAVSPKPYGVVYENGKAKTQWLMPDGSLTTSLLDANNAEYAARTERLAREFRGRMAENGLDPENADDVKKQAQLDYEAPLRDVMEEAWQRAEADDRKAGEQYRKDYKKSRHGGFLDMAKEALTTAFDAGGQPLQRSSDYQRYLDYNIRRKETFNLEKLAESVYRNMPQSYRDSQKLAYSDYYRKHPQELKGRSVAQAADDALRGEAYRATYERAVKANMPKSKTEFFLRKVADQPFLSQSMATDMATSALTGSYDMNLAEADAMGRYGKEHRGLDVAGTVANMAFDPVTYISGGVGSILGKKALEVAGKAMLKGATKDVAARYAGRTLAGRLVAGAAGGAGNFGTFETLKDIEGQMRMGGTVDAKTGERGFSGREVLKATLCGTLLGSATGMMSPLIGNVADKLVKPATSVMGKASVRAGELVTSTIAEGTIFSAPEWIVNASMADDDPNKRSAMDVWTDNMAMMLGFKASHAVKSAPRVIAGLRPIAEPKTMQEREHNRRSFMERLRERMDTSPSDMDFTPDERMELESHGYGDLAALFIRTPEGNTAVKTAVHKDSGRKVSGTEGRGIVKFEGHEEAKVERAAHPEFDGYSSMEALMQDKRVSQSARAKAYYILTGRQLPMGTVTGYTTDEDADGGVTVQAVTMDGEVVTSRHFTDDGKAQGEIEKIKRQAELNAVDVGEHYKDMTANMAVLEAAVKQVAPGADMETVLRNYKAVKEGDADAVRNYGEMMEEIDKAIESNRDIADVERPEGIRAAIMEETGVDVDTALKKTADRRSEEEDAAVKDYLKRLFPEQNEGKAENDGETADTGTDTDAYADDRAEAAAAYDRSRLLWDKVEQGDADAKADLDAINLRMQEAWQMCEESFGDDAETRMAEMQDDPWGMVNDPELTVSQQDAVLYYIKAKAELDGVTDASNDAMENRRREVAATVDRHTHKVTGMVQPATVEVGNRRVYIVKGNVATYPDGTGVDTANSDQIIVVCDAETGEYEFVSPYEVLSLDGATDPQVELDEAYGRIQAEQEAMLGAAGSEDAGAEQPQMTEEQMRQYAQSAFNEATQAGGGIPLPEEQVQGMQQYNRQMLEQEKQRKEAEANRQPSALERVPVDENTGEPMFERVDAKTALDALGEVTGGNAENTSAIVGAQLEQAVKALDALKKKTPKKKKVELKGSPMQMVRAQLEADVAYNTAMEEYDARLRAAEESKEAWSRVSALLNERRRAAREEQETERKVRVERMKAEAGIHAVSPKLKAKWDAAPKVEGSANAVTLEDGSVLRGHYVLTEAGAATASHDVKNAYEPTEGFPVDENGESVNDRDYHRDEDAQLIVREMAEGYDGRALQSPVIVSDDGIVLSGNNRTMSGDLAAEHGTDGAYVEHLKEYGGMYGFTAEQVDGMKHPRVVFVPDEHLPYDARTFARFNAESQKKQSKPEHAVKLGKVVPDGVFNNIVGDISRYDRLSDYYADEKAVAGAINLLRDAGVINEMQLPELRTGNCLSASGKELIENTLIGKVFQTSPDAVRQIIGNNTLRQSVVMGLNEIAHNRTLAVSGYDLSKELAAAIDLVSRAKAEDADGYKQGRAVSSYGRQLGLFDDEYGDSRVMDGVTLLLADLLNSGKPSDLRKMLSVYNELAQASAGGQLDMFSGGLTTKEEILNAINDKFKDATRKEQEAMVSAAVAGRKGRAYSAGAGEGAYGAGGDKKNVNSAGIFRKGYSNKKETVVKTEPQQPNNAVSSDSSLSVDKHSGIMAAEPNGESTVSSGDKVINNPATLQEKGGKSSVVEDKKALSANGKWRKADMETRSVDAGVKTPAHEDSALAGGKETSAPYGDSQKVLMDSQGNPINADGTLRVEKVHSVDELTDEDFTRPTRNVELPELPKNVDRAIGADGKPVVIKRNIFERNVERHHDLSAEQSRSILQSALYRGDLYGQNQKAKRPYNWVVINTKDERGVNRTVLLEVSPKKDNVEIVHWHYIDERGLAKIKRQAEREDGQLLILPSEKSEEAGALSSPTHNLSSGAKLVRKSENGKGSGEKKVSYGITPSVSNKKGNEESGPGLQKAASDDIETVAQERAAKEEIAVPHPELGRSDRSYFLEDGEYAYALSASEVPLMYIGGDSYEERHFKRFCERYKQEVGDFIYKQHEKFLRDFFDYFDAVTKRRTELDVGVETPAHKDSSVGSAGGKETSAPYEDSQKVLMNSQGNPINADGTLRVEKVHSVDELTDEDFMRPTRNVELPELPKNVDRAIGADGKPVVIKKNIFEKNRKSHKDLSPAQGREILANALYRPDMYGQNQKTTRPYNWILVHNAEKHSSVILEVNHGKDNVEIVNWHYLDDKTLRQKERQAVKEGGLVLTLESTAGNTLDDLSSSAKLVRKSENGKGSGKKKVSYGITPSVYTNKKGKNTAVSLLKFDGALTAEQERAVKEFAKERMGDGRFAPARGWKDRESGGWMFRGEEDARRAAEMVGSEKAVADAQPMTAQELRDAVEPKADGVTKRATAKPKPTNKIESVSSSEPAKEEKPIQAKQGTEKKLVITDEMKADEDVLREILGIGDDELDKGMMFRDPDEFTPEQRRRVYSAGVNYALGYIDQGFVLFPEFAKAMSSRLGYKIKPWLKSLYEGAKRIPGYEEMQFTPTDEVDRFDVENFDKPLKDVLAQANMMVEEGKAQVAAEKANKELKARRNEQRKEADEQRAADTVAIAEKAGTDISEAEAVEASATDERTVSASAERVDASLSDVNDQLALLGYYAADKVEKDYYEAYGYMLNAERKAVADAKRLAESLIDDLGLDRYEATHEPMGKGGVRKKKPLAVADIAPGGGDISIHLPLNEGRELYVSVILHSVVSKGVTSEAGDNLQADSIVYRVNNPNGNGGDRYGNNVWVDASLPYGELLKGIERVAYKYLSGGGDAEDGVYRSGDMVEYSSDGGRTWQDARVVNPDDGGYVLLDTGLAPVMYVSAKHEQLRHKEVLADAGVKTLAHKDSGNIENLDVLGGLEVGAVETVDADVKTTAHEDSGSALAGVYNQAKKNGGEIVEIKKEDGSEDGLPLIQDRKGSLAADLSALPPSSNGIVTRKKTDSQKKGKKKVNPQQMVGDLFAGLMDEETETNNNKNNVLRRNDETVRTSGVPADSGRQQEGLRGGEGETRQGSSQTGGRADRGREGQGTGHDRSVSAGLHGLSEGKNTRNNRSERGVDHAPTSVNARIDANVRAIELARELLESSETATPEQMSVLRQFSGWGGLGAAFSDGGYDWKVRERNKKIRELLGKEGYEQAVMSANSSYYTPAYVVDTLWDIANQLGFKGGNILEGSAGIGNILGQMPQNISNRSDIHAIEIDGTSGGILSLLYPDAKVEVQGFEQTRIPNGSVDLAITNVPFVTGLRVNDTTGDGDLSKKFHNIHDFCIAKNVRKLREGGLGIFISSNGTLDNSKALRDWVVNEGGSDFIGAFRMNNKTFGGTTVTSDIIVIRKRVNGQQSANAIDVSTVSGERTAEYRNPRERKAQLLSMDYNKYFMEHPERMAGEMRFAFEEGDTFRPASKGLYPVPGKDQGKMLADFVKSFKEEDNSSVSIAESSGSLFINDVSADGRKVGELYMKDGKLVVAGAGGYYPLEVNGNKIKGHTKLECFNGYSAIKSALSDVMRYQTEHDDDKGLQPLIEKLNKAYDDFVDTYGHFNKNNQLAWLRNDVDYPNVFSLEVCKEQGDGKGSVVKTYDKADVMKGRVVEKEHEPHPETVKDGVMVSMFKNGRIDVPYIAGQLGMGEAEVKREIIESGLGFEDPASRQLEVSYQYLSGNVREKLHQAEANNDNGMYDRNVKALREVVPMNIPAHLIDFTLGSSWLDAQLYDEYVKDRTDIDVRFTAVGGTWFMKAPSYGLNVEKNRVAGVTSDMVGKTIMGHELIEAAIQNKTITVSKTVKHWDGTTESVTDREATALCAARIDEIRQDFKDWARQRMQSDADLSARMEEEYNDRFNNYVPMKIPDDFVPEYFGGAARKFKMRPHQGKAIVRGTMQPLLLAHEVGTGKTFTLISTAMEMRRLGTARKPMIVVQNATVGQFVSSAKELYPNAKILALEDSDRNADGRKRFYAKIKYNDWDMIVVPQSTFEFIPDSDERKMSFVQDKIEEKMRVLEQMRKADGSGRDPMTRRAEKELLNLQAELAALTDDMTKKRSANNEKKRAVAKQNAAVKAEEMLDRCTDDVEDFDDMGIDALLIDEAHEYKHLGFATEMQRGVKGVDPSYSKKSQGVYLKTQAVLEKNHGRNVVFATGTPISNTATEIWTFMRYLMPKDTMKEYGIYYFDDFVRNFGNIQQMLEFTTSGKFKENNRFAGYVTL